MISYTPLKSLVSGVTFSSLMILRVSRALESKVMVLVLRHRSWLESIDQRPDLIARLWHVHTTSWILLFVLCGCIQKLTVHCLTLCSVQFTSAKLAAASMPVNFNMRAVNLRISASVWAWWLLTVANRDRCSYALLTYQPLKLDDHENISLFCTCYDEPILSLMLAFVGVSF